MGTGTLRREPAPIHCDLAPVCHYAEDLAEQMGERRHVVQIPEGSAAFGMGFRYVSVEDQELGYYQRHGAIHLYTACVP